jgi:rRNA small subunit pseudouridine methyltransferase Nep1
MRHENKYSLIIAEASLEMVPAHLRNHPAVKAHAARLGRDPGQTLLDKSYHHAAMQNERFFSKRGRPDIVHFSLAAVLASPLYIDNQVRVYVSTVDNNCILIGERVRFPKSYSRFEGLMIDLFNKKKVMSRNEAYPLLELNEGLSFKQLIEDIISPKQLIGFSTIGATSTIEKVVSDALSLNSSSCAFVIGGFSKGHFSETTTGNFTGLFNISRMRLDAHVVVARLVYECEKILLDK